MIKKIALISIIALSTFACQKQTFVVSKDANYTTMPTNPTYEGWEHQFIYGLVSFTTHDATKMCKGGVDMVGTKQTFLNGLAAGLTFSLYTPRTYQVQCSK
jgi:hypothetical protein